MAAAASIALASAPLRGGRSAFIDGEARPIARAASPPRRGGESTRSERRLLRAAQDGSEEALEALFRRHWPMAHRAAYLVVQDASAAEDIAQEAFLAAVRALDRFDRRRPFGPWLHRIVVNRGIDWARARALRADPVADVESAGGAAEISGEDPLPETGALSGPVLAALARLDPERRAIVVMRHLLELTPGEIAAALGIPRGTVNSRLRRALDQLAGELEEERG